MKFLADENFDNTIIRGLLRRQLNIDIVRVQDVSLSGKDDPTVLEWAAKENRILLTHDVATITHYAYNRLAESKPMPGVIEYLLLLLSCSLDGELEGQIFYFPLR